MWNIVLLGLGLSLWVIICKRIVAMHLLDGPETDFGSDEGGFYEAGQGFNRLNPIS
jgi:hypothetical protein